MPLRRPNRASLAPRSVTVAFVLGLCAALLLVSAAPASAVTRKQAAKKALAALGSKNGSNAVIVFGLTKPVRPGARVTQTGGTKTVGKAGNGGAFFFYEDSGPGQAYPHAGRVALVGAKSGKVKVSRTITRAPRINGALPAFLTSSKRYSSSKYRVFARSAPAPAPSGPLFANDPFGPGPTFTEANFHPKAHDQTVIAKQNVPKNITLVGSDPDDEPLTFDISQQPDHGTLSGQPPDVTYTPDHNFLGKDKFAFRVTDGADDSNIGHVTILVKPVGLPPTVTTSAGCTAYTEQSPAVFIDSSLMVSDLDDVTLDHATVRIPFEPVGGEEGDPTTTQDGDELLFTDQNGISGSYDALTKTLRLTGTATVANYQTALRSVRYRNLSDPDPEPTKDVEFVVNDAGSDSAPATKQICISGGGAGDNNRPIGETSEGGLDYIENDGPLPVDGGFFVVDADSANLSGATIKFTESQPPEDEEGNPIGDPVNNFVSAEDELAFQDQNGITGSYDDTLGIMTLSGIATVAQYEAAIRSVTYENTSEDPSGEPRTVRFQVTDEQGLSSVPSNRGILVTPVNDAPVVTTTEGSGSGLGSDPTVVVDSGLTTLDVDDDDLESARVTVSGGAEPGDQLALDENSIASGISVDWDGTVLTLTGTASVADYEAALRLVEYRHPGGNPGGTKTIEFIVNDGDLDSAPATKNIEVNDKPVLDTSDDALAYSEGDGAVAADSGIAATDDDSADLVGATVQISGNYTQGEDVLALAEQNGISGTFDPDTGTLTITGTASVGDYDAALGDVRYENTSENPSEATRTLTFQADDGGSTNNLSDPATRDITVARVNDAPVLDTSDDALAYTENDGPVAADEGITAADVDSGDLVGATVQITGNFTSGEDTLSFDDAGGITAGPFDSETGTLTLTGTATVAEYQAALAAVKYQNGSEDPSEATRTLTFQADDGGSSNNLSAPATRDITVAAVNDAPVVTTSEGSTTYTIGDSEGATVDADVTVTDADDTNIESAVVQISGFEAGDDLVYVNQLGIAGVYNSGTGVLTLTGSAPVADYQTALASIKYRTTNEAPSPSRTIEFTVNDGDDDSAVASKSIDLVAANEAPVVTTSAGNSSYTLGDTAGAEIDNALTVSDADDTNLESAFVQIQGFEPGDELIFTDQLGITGSVGETGDLSLSGSAPLSDYQTALRSVKFRHSGDNQANTRSVAFKVNDGSADSAFAFKTIDLVDPPPPAPPPE